MPSGSLCIAAESACSAQLRSFYNVPSRSLTQPRPISMRGEWLQSFACSTVVAEFFESPRGAGGLAKSVQVGVKTPAMAISRLAAAVVTSRCTLVIGRNRAPYRHSGGVPCAIETKHFASPENHSKNPTKQWAACRKGYRSLPAWWANKTLITIVGFNQGHESVSYLSAS